MWKASSNSKSVVSRINRNLNSVKGNQAIRAAVFSVYGLTSKRIFSNGKNASGRSLGVYQEEYYRRRIKRFRRSNRNINLIATGELEREWQVGDFGNGMGLGFTSRPNKNSKNPNAAQKADYMEDRFFSIFKLSPQEIKKFKEILNFETNKRLGR